MYPLQAQTAWMVTQSFFARDAFQAAAADGECFYAIASKSIGKYDRRTGKRLATSIGDARHLNSGFLKGEYLYCAHSNYPAKPERSQIFRLDIADMQLELFKDFGDYGGSLTWAVFKEGSWWLNFAYYGDLNHQTYLAKFDPQWKELGRWTYPEEVLSQLGRYSLSGGVWVGEELLVTGHDDPVAFVLKLPVRGDTLEWLRTESVPFYGQGIANDPKTGGLVGIRRSRLKVVFAESEGASTASSRNE